MHFAFYALLSLTHAIFAGADKHTTSARLMESKTAKALATPKPAIKVKMGKSGKATITPTPAPPIPGFVISGVDQSLKLVSCNPTSVEVAGSRAAEVKQGSIIIYTPHDTDTCTSCNPLFRKVQSISTSLFTGNLILATTFLSVSEIIQVGSNPDDITLGSEMLEPLFDCSHSGSQEGSLDATAHGTIGDVAISYDKLPPPQPLLSWDVSILTGSCNDDWLQKKDDGRCTYTNCYVGESGSATDCFECKDNCDNGCGSRGLTTDGKFGTFDFGPACCNHDYCWSSSSFTKDECDIYFHDDMKSQCPPHTQTITILGFPVVIKNLSYLRCDALASIFFGIVKRATYFYNSAQTAQKNYEQENICVAKCPTTQESGGQGTTVLNIDMLRTSGTFQVSYEMYSVPDQLFIKYEGQTIFDTGGLVSGGNSASVNFNGSSSIITVTIYAPNAGTVWDVHVGCPSP